jgi:cathepsin D
MNRLDMRCAFSPAYGSGSAQGQLATDTVSLGSFTVPKQTFGESRRTRRCRLDRLLTSQPGRFLPGLVSKASNNLIFSPISGILGFGFQPLAQSGATVRSSFHRVRHPLPPFHPSDSSSSCPTSPQPWWLSLVDSWPSPLFAFHLTRHSSSSNSVNPGGTLTLGHTDDSLYEGSIAWNTVTSQTYWVVSLDGAVVESKAVAFNANKGAAIDTGTTLCLGPVADVAAVYKQIPGAREVSAGSWVIPCSTTTTVAFSFGGTVYPFAAADLMRGLYRSGGSECIGAITGLDLGGGAPMGWIIGAAWLKNVRPSLTPPVQTFGTRD